MNDHQTERAGVAEDYPGRIVHFPAEVSHLVMNLIGVQSAHAETRANFVLATLALMQAADGPLHCERGEYVDGAGIATTVLIAYWTDRATAARWWRNPAVASWWRSLEVGADVGYFRERMNIPRERFNYAAGTEDRHGCAAALGLEACTTFGYWGAYRDRLPASRHDDFVSPLPAPPAPSEQATRGRRLSVSIPDNLCYIREGQGWANCQAEERRIWDEDMNGVIDQWVERLAAHPAATGCLAIRDCREQDLDSGATHQRRTQLAYLLSLGHIEQAARTDPAHLAVHGAFIRMYTNPKFTPRMHVWVELAVLKREEFDCEYINCHPHTGLLPFFPAHDVDPR